LAALSKAETNVFKAVLASAFFPAVAKVAKLFSRVCKRDLVLVFWVRLRALLRMRRSADFVFGINQFKIEGQNVAEPVLLSTGEFEEILLAERSLLLFIRHFGRFPRKFVLSPNIIPPKT